MYIPDFPCQRQVFNAFLLRPQPSDLFRITDYCFRATEVSTPICIVNLFSQCQSHYKSLSVAFLLYSIGTFTEAAAAAAAQSRDHGESLQESRGGALLLGSAALCTLQALSDKCELKTCGNAFEC